MMEGLTISHMTRDDWQEYHTQFQTAQERKGQD